MSNRIEPYLQRRHITVEELTQMILELVKVELQKQLKPVEERLKVVSDQILAMLKGHQ